MGTLARLLLWWRDNGPLLYDKDELAGHLYFPGNFKINRIRLFQSIV